MRNLFATQTAAALLLLILTGCHLGDDFGPPGDIDSQRARSLLHDPFPIGELGPAIPGTRPRDFDLPRNEIQKLQSSPNARRSGRQNGFGGLGAF